MYRFTIFFFTLFITSFLCGQERSIPLNISFYNESTAIPFTRFLTTPIHPGVQAGSEFTIKNKGDVRLFQTVNMCYFYHDYLAQGIGLQTELGYEYSFSQRYTLTGLLGFGYIHTFATTKEFSFLNGKYSINNDKGNPRIYPSVSIDIGYNLKEAAKYSPKIFLRYQSWVEYPYSPDFIPLMTHINLHIGIKLFIHSKIKKND